MNDAFALLGLERRLEIREEEVREALREAGKRCHPDAGGSEGDFSRMQQAAGVIASPAGRLRLWAGLRGCAVEPRGEISPGMMEIFSGVGALMQSAEAVIRKREGAKTALGLAMLEGEILSVRGKMEKAIGGIDLAIAEECAVFPEWEGMAELPAADDLGKTLRNLMFLEKWRSGLRAGYARLV